eukprot:GHRQ01037701.1.p1 GENE.GHRQ01037701.1~~GHRQ01037701.1.p1  ORF type:complete len:225 (+),score=62.76 GHRQ01037701.1:22-675(+)
MRILRMVPAGVLLLGLLLLPASLAKESDTSKHVPGLDVTKETINTTLKAMPADAKVLMEFYATWCPACRAFKPDYDKVAQFLASQPAGSNKVTALRLDCAVDPDVCGQYQVSAYPTMYSGTAADLAAVDVSKLTKFDFAKYSRNAAGAVKFVAESFKLDLKYVDTPAAESAPDAAPPRREATTNLASDMQVGSGCVPQCVLGFLRVLGSCGQAVRCL